MTENLALAAIVSSLFTVPAIWLLCFLLDPWPDGMSPIIYSVYLHWEERP